MAPKMRSLVSSAMGLGALLVASSVWADDASCISATEQALALRQQGKLHDALKQLSACAEPACPDEVKAECAKRISEIDAVMPTLILAAKDLVGNDLDEVQVTMDGAPFASRLDGRPVSVDPGEHKFRFTFLQAPPSERAIVIREGERDRRESVVMQIKPPKPPSYWNGQRFVALTTTVLGVAGLAVGATFGAFAISVQNQEKSDCGPAGCPAYAQSVNDYRYAQTNATASTVLFVVGGVLAAAGVVLFLTAHTAVSVAPTVGTGSGGLVLSGAFW